MSQNKSQTHAQDVLNTMRGTARAAWTPWVGLCMGDPRGAGVEASYSGYTRQQATFAAPAGQSVSTSAGLSFPAPTEAVSGAADWAGVWDAQTNGTLRYALPISNPTAWVIGQPPQVATGALVISEL